LEQLLNHEELIRKRIPLLFFANKMDIGNALSPAECMEELELQKITDKAYHIAQSNALTGKGIDEGISWLAEQLSRRK